MLFTGHYYIYVRSVAVKYVISSIYIYIYIVFVNFTKIKNCTLVSSNYYFVFRGIFFPKKSWKLLRESVNKKSIKNENTMFEGGVEVA